MSASNSATPAEPASLPHPARPGAARYRVFLSYSHADTKWARWLMRQLEFYRVPRRFHGRVAPIGEVGWRIAPVFRDRDELPTTSDLGETIRGALRESATLVVICSPNSAKSRWVQEEILAFKRLHGEKRVFAFIIGGEPKIEGAADDCFSPALRVELGADGQLSSVPAEVVAADARAEGDGPKLAFIRLVAGLLGVGFDELRQRELQRRNRRLMVITGCSVAGMALTFGLAVVAWQARNDARRRQDQAEDVMAFMLGGFRDELKKVGRLDLLNKVGTEATKYFHSLEERDLTDTALARHAKALTQIGEIRMDEARFDEALRAFTTANERAAVLARRHPEDGDMLFERAQTEFWIGAVHRKRGDVEATRTWALRYRDTARALVALERQSPRAQREVVSGHHNLAVLEFDQANYAAARQAFLGEQASVLELLAASPGDTGLRAKLGDIASWLGLIAEREGDFSEALRRLAEAAAQAEELRAQEPAVVRWRLRVADAVPLIAHVQARMGRWDAAAAGYARAREISDALVAQDPKNREWRMRSASIQLSQVELLIAMGEVANASVVLRGARAEVEQLVATEPTAQTFARMLVKVWRCETTLRRLAGHPEAREAARRATELGGKLLGDRRADDWTIWEFTQSQLLAGQLDRDAGNLAAAQENWRLALAVVTPRLLKSNDWRFIDTAGQAHALLGEKEQAGALIERLRRFGYRPLNPFAASLLEAVIRSDPNPAK